MEISGLHHITAICGDVQDNVDFYGKVLGLRLVKVTINFDDPGTYHLYYGDRVGSPGSCLTFFAWPNLPAGRAGYSQAGQISFSVPTGSLAWWKSTLEEHKIAVSRTQQRGEDTLAFADPDGISLELVEREDSREAWTGYSVSVERAIRGFDSVTMLVGRLEASREHVAKMGFRTLSEDSGTTLLGIKEAAPGQRIKLQASTSRGAPGVGTIHHVAFATRNDATQRQCSDELSAAGAQPTTVQERQYFRSIYFREPSGVLYEIATEGPGFLVDETDEKLGSSLCVPPWFEKFRGQIEASLPRFVSPTGVLLPK